MGGVTGGAEGASKVAVHGVASSESVQRELGEQLRRLLPQLPRRSADLITWCCDVMCAVAARESENRMSAHAIAVVFAPPLMRGAVRGADADDNPLAAVLSAQQSVELAAALLAAHKVERLRGTSL